MENDLDATVKRYQEMLEFDPESKEALEGLRPLYRQLERWSELTDVLRRSIHISFDAVHVIQLCEELAGILENRLDDPQAAIDVWRRVLELDLMYEPALNGLLRLYRSMETWPEVLDLLQLLRDIATDDEQFVALTMEQASICKEQLGNLDGARRLYQEVLLVEPEHEAALRALSDAPTGS